MTDRLLELAERLEAAKPDVGSEMALEFLQDEVKRALWEILRVTPRRFLSSLDDALDLVPDGWSFNLGNDTQPWAMLWIDTPSYDGVPYRGHAATPALALCAAAIRTLAAQQDTAKGDPNG